MPTSGGDERSQTCRDDQRRGHGRVESRTSDGAAGTTRAPAPPPHSPARRRRHQPPVDRAIVRSRSELSPASPTNRPRDREHRRTRRSRGLRATHRRQRTSVDRTAAGRLATLLRLHAGANQAQQESRCHGGHVTSQRHLLRPPSGSRGRAAPVKGRPGFITWIGLAVVVRCGCRALVFRVGRARRNGRHVPQADVAVPRLHRRGRRRVDGGVAIPAAQPGRGTIRPPTHLGIARLDRRRERSPPGPGGSGHGPAHGGWQCWSAPSRPGWWVRSCMWRCWSAAGQTAPSRNPFAR